MIALAVVCVSSGCDLKSTLAKARLSAMLPQKYYENPAMINLLRGVELADEIAIRAAVEAGADVNENGREGMSPLMWAMVKDSPRGFGLLLKRGADVDRPAFLPREDRPLLVRPSIAEVAAIAKQGDFLNELLVAGIDPNLECRSVDGSLLFAAILYRRPGNVRRLLDGGANVDATNAEHETPLHVALSIGDWETMWALVDSGADPAIADKYGKTIADYMLDPRRMIDSEQKPWYDKLMEELEKRGLVTSP